MPTPVTVNEGRVQIGAIYLKQSDVNRGTSLSLGLFTNTSGLSNTSVLADITEPTGGSYAQITLADASWSDDGLGVYSYAKQTFNASGSGYSADIYGWFIRSTGTTPKLISYQIEDTPVTVAVNESYSVTPKYTITG